MEHKRLKLRVGGYAGVKEESGRVEGAGRVVLRRPVRFGWGVRKEDEFTE